jgi:hypothetical protein
MLVDELPSWVYFPDKERAEWLNNIIKQLWPNVNNYVRSIFSFFRLLPVLKSKFFLYCRFSFFAWIMGYVPLLLIYVVNSNVNGGEGNYY